MFSESIRAFWWSRHFLTPSHLERMSGKDNSDCWPLSQKDFAHRTMNEYGTLGVSGQLDIHNASFATDLLLQKYYKMFKKVPEFFQAHHMREVWPLVGRVALARPAFTLHKWEERQIGVVLGEKFQRQGLNSAWMQWHRVGWVTWINALANIPRVQVWKVWRTGIGVELPEALKHMWQATLMWKLLAARVGQKFCGRVLRLHEWVRTCRSFWIIAFWCFVLNRRQGPSSRSGSFGCLECRVYISVDHWAFYWNCSGYSWQNDLHTS